MNNRSAAFNRREERADAAQCGCMQAGTKHAGGWNEPPGGPPAGGFGAPPTPPPGGYGAPPPGGGGFGAPPPNPYAPPAPFTPGPFGQLGYDHQLASSAQTWFVLGIVCAATCCLPFGALGAWQAHEAKNLMHTGDVEGARSKLGMSKVLTGIGFGTLALMAVVWVLMMFAGILVR
jgi:hypothetical protein